MKVYGFGIIGCGRIAQSYLDAMKHLTGSRLVAGADINEQVLQDMVDQYGCLGYKDYHEMLKNADVDIVVICTASGMHAKMAIDAIKAGKHVLVEKPMAMSLAEADVMIAEAKRAKVKLGVAHQNRFNKAIVELRQAVEQGEFGKFTHGSAVIRWNRDDKYYAQAAWRGSFAMDGGCLLNQSVHNIDLLQWMLGPVESIFAYTATHLRNIEAEDNAVAVLKFANGALATIEASTTIYPDNLEETLNIFGSTGSVIIGGIAVNKIEVWRLPNKDEKSVLEAQYHEPPNVYGFGHIDLVQDFMNAITENREPAISGVEGRKALEIILAIYHSVKYKKEIILPLQEEFTLGIGI